MSEQSSKGERIDKTNTCRTLGIELGTWLHSIKVAGHDLNFEENKYFQLLDYPKYFIALPSM